MKKFKRTLSLLVAVNICFFVGTTFTKADVADSEIYTINIPSATIVELAAATNDFGVITSADFGNGNIANHNIIVGDGTLSSTSYVQSNDPTAGAKQYQLDFAPNGGSTVSVADAGSKAVLTLTNASATASVDINITNNAKSAYPSLGDSGTGTVVTFTTQDADTLNIPANSSVPFNPGTKKAPLNMVMDLDENSLSLQDVAGSISFDMTLTVVGLN